MKKKAKILFFASDPGSVGGRRPRLQLDQEVKEIRERVSRAKRGHDLEFDFRMAASVDDLLDAMEESEPRVVHFSGHAGEGGLVLAGRDASTRHHVGPAALADLFEHYRGDIRVVVLNACQTLAEAQAIASVVGCAIGARTEITDDAAIAFGSAFYGAIAHGESVKTAFTRGRVALSVKHFDERDFPQLVVRPDVNPGKLFIVEPKRSRVGRVVTSLAGVALAIGIPVYSLWPPPCAWAGTPEPAAEASIKSAMAQSDFDQAMANYDARRFGVAFEQFKRLAELGNAEAMAYVGEMLLRGEGTTARPDSGVWWLRQAAYYPRRNPRAMTALGYASEAGLGVDRSIANAREWYQKAVTEKNWADARRRLGLLDHAEEKDSAALENFRDAAKTGSLEARIDAGEMYQNGEATEPDMKMAVCLYETAADAGSVRGMLIMGQLRRTGMGLSQDGEKAAEWYRKAANRGSPAAMQALGEMYRDGEGVPRNEALATQYFEGARRFRRR